MVAASTIYAITALCFAIPWLVLWFGSSLSIGKMIILLFFFDVALTVEAGLFSNLALIALLHMITIPAFFALIYLDVMAQHTSEFTCFVCGSVVARDEPTEMVKRIVNGRRRNVLVHERCVKLQGSERKAFRSKLFKKGIPE